MSPLRLFGVTGHDGRGAALPAALPQGAEVVHFRDLAALVAEAAHARPSVSEADVEAQRAAVSGVFARQAVLPAPAGTVFRTRDALARWLELHYFALSDALAFVEGRAGARVHVARRAESALTPIPRAEELAIDIDDVAADAFRVLRRHAVASVSLRSAPGTPAVNAAAASAAFLVERDRWRVFADVVAEEARRDPALLFRMTGPWPPYDFVRMQFGG